MADPIKRAPIAQEKFGDWGVVGYEYTSWGEVFPELKALTQAVTGKRVTFGLAMAWFSQRYMVSQYLKFCGENFPHLAFEGALTDGNDLMLALDDVRKSLLEILDSIGRATDPTGMLEGELRAKLRSSLPHYQFILNNYMWLKRVPFGAVPVVSDGTHYRYQPQKIEVSISQGMPTPCPKPIQKLTVSAVPFPAAALLQREALRLYPIITSMCNGTPAFFWANSDRVLMGQDKKVREVLAAMQVPRPGGQMEKWGMLRGVGNDECTVARQWQQQDAKKLWNGVPVRWEGESWKALWSCIDYSGDVLRGIPKAVLYQLSTGVVAGSEDTVIEIACPDLSPTPSAADKPAVHHLPPQIVDVLLVPVGYEDAKKVNTIIGGNPMWPEPMTDQLLSQLSQSFG